jgi:ABC-type bacteriocin/lantibiotic exporter with double-glycine peptidase domain
LVQNGQQLQIVGAHLERITDVVTAVPEQTQKNTTMMPSLTGQIEVQHLSFQYSPNTPHVLQDISFAVQPGQKVAIVGATGAGKSTLMKLLLGLYPATSGDIQYDGRSLTALNLHALRQQTGVVLQKPFLFNGSIRQNLTFNNPRIPLDRVTWACQRACIHEDIMAMPMSYETVLAEGGSNLSGGQQQRLGLARALIHQPAVLLLDEATSHLDVMTEATVNRHLSGLACTRIVIAHRLSTVIDAALILVLHQGRLVEKGTHESLLAQQGHYADLIKSKPSLMAYL